MKRLIGILAAVCMAVVFVSCGAAADNKPGTDNPSPAQVSDIISQQAELTDRYYETYLSTLSLSSIVSASWDNAEQITADRLTSFYLINTLYKEHPDGWSDMLEVPAQEVEQSIQSYFEVSSAHIRQSGNYREEANSYLFGYGIGSSSYLVVTGAEQQDDLLILSYDFRDPADKLFAQGSVNIIITEEGYQYSSCKYKRLD